ncbi:MAG: hypothetical protein Q7K21_08150 [Elusimicrobiota bacterium]|nr:hypothetical protein [Elusimicrobiota bacterium]
MDIELIKIHDKFQFEIKHHYKFHNENRETDYQIDTYFFLPSSLHINRYTYKKENFYNDIRAYIRFTTPTFLLSDYDDILQKIRQSCEALAHAESIKNYNEYEKKIKLFCCILKSSIRDYIEFIKQNKIPSDTDNLIKQYRENIVKIMASYRDLRQILNVPTVSSKKFSVYLYGDEYISLLVERYIYALLDILKEKGIVKHNELLLSLIRDEIDYRIKNNYPSVPREGSKNEELVYRRSILKKYMNNVLFLSIDSESEGKLAEQLLFGIAAGLSMAFATMISFYSQMKFGNLSLAFFIALVISYMFKDRIKEITRIYFLKKVGRQFYDHKLTLYDQNKEKIGWYKESFDFVKEPNIPDEILRLRNRVHFTEIENGWVGEKIVLYRRAIKLFPLTLKELHGMAPIDQLTDIIRFNVHNFLASMDNPKQDLYVADKNGYNKISGNRVYHLNLVLKYKLDNNVTYKRFRLILTREGIERIEPVAA